MRIAISFDVGFGGVARAMFDHARALKSMGHDVTFFCRERPDLPKLPFAEVGELVALPLAWEALPLTSSRQAIWAQVTGYDHMVKAFLPFARAVGARIDAGGFDLLYAQNWETFHTAPIGLFVTSMPKLVYANDPYRALYEATPRLPLIPPAADEPFKERLRDYFLHRAARKRGRLELDSILAFDRVLVNSYYSRETYLRAFGVDSEVCYLGIDTDRFTPNPQPAGDYVFGLGAMAASKGVHRVVEALGRIPQPGRPRLVWSANMGDEGYRAEVARRAEELGVAFEFHQNLPDPEVKRLMAGAITLVYANRLEPFGLVPLEANACGLAVVAVAEGGVRETIRDGVNGVLVNGDPDSLAQAVVTLRDDPELRAHLGVSARKEVEDKWSLAAAQERLQNALERFMRDMK